MVKKFVLGLIPARGGSKGIKDKNLVDLAGKPLIAHSIETALRSKLDDVIVSTDSEKIADISKSFGANIQMRQSSLSQDKTEMLPVMKHALKEYERVSGKHVDILVLLQPTSPFRTAEQINKTIEVLLKPEWDSVFSIVELEVSPDWIVKNDSDRIKFAFGKNFDKIRRQDMDKYYRIHGLIKAFKRSVVLNAKKYAFGKNAFALVTTKKEAIDIDEPKDLEMAKKLFN